MVRTRKLRHEEVTYSRVFEEDTNVLIALEDPKKTTKLLANLIRHKPVIGEAVAHHLGILPEQCDIADPKDWLLGGFNVCLPVSTPKQKVLIRFPVLHRVGDDFRPGNADEKIRCEVGTYAWLAKNCPSVPVPKLYGFGLSTGQTV